MLKFGESGEVPIKRILPGEKCNIGKSSRILSIQNLDSERFILSSDRRETQNEPVRVLEKKQKAK